MGIAPLKIALALVLLASLSFGAWALFFHHPIPPERSQATGFEGPTRASYPDSPRLISSSTYDHTIGVLLSIAFSSPLSESRASLGPTFHPQKGRLFRQMCSVDRTSITPDKESAKGEKIDQLDALPLPIRCVRESMPVRQCSLLRVSWEELKPGLRVVRSNPHGKSAGSPRSFSCSPSSAKLLSTAGL